jgi:hypothetical protein
VCHFSEKFVVGFEVVRIRSLSILCYVMQSALVVVYVIQFKGIL